MFGLKFKKNSADSIIIRSPEGSGDPIPPSPVVISLFEALAHTKRSSSVGSVAETGSAFSAKLASQNPHGFFTSMTIKSPGTDFYLPSSLGQFASAVEQIVVAQYNGTDSSPHLRAGREYCVMTVSQPLDYIRPHLCAVANQHFDITYKSIEERELAVIDRYIVSDIAELTTAFYDADFNVTDDILDNWGDTQTSIIQASGSSPRQYQGYEIAHFDSTTAHGIVRGPALRTRLSLSFSSQPFSDQFSTPDLKAEHKNLTFIRRDLT